ncbi:PREDICTED: uncharacterized protein LOC104804028 [Tarenaya hassleriana]|uniref:uncharacterized protein LOC104804028 n=1 Tax=Tarenaya hassleriana TaxID=28532 RepID=UPI00053C62B7|nr:PREDICTED: uncharacterized protein LOC104804028 [Tarenaya hassleriana]XP_010526472.1 PREDICTED: uncharacterized protein LOC104804028 [Tarenaya hassleriana]XP_010526473.1 PREDICTED: uncharacterized protein LOC104804028 [Tarenaya hassleriana]
MGSIGRKVQNMESPVPGCLGSMVNLFVLDATARGNKFLTDKPHNDASSLSRSRSDVVQMLSPSFGDHTEAELVLSNLRRSASDEVNGTPMKKLIAREMSKEVERKQNPTNVVAKLMGLDTLPQLQLDNTASQQSYEDAYEMWQPPQKVNRSRDSSSRKGKNDEAMREKQIALVREKFMEAKRLVTDEKLHQSKEFQDALEVLSSNKDLFVKFLQESNSFLSQHLSDYQPVPPHLETKRITVLRPSKAVDTAKFVVQDRRNKQIKKSTSSVHRTGWDNRYPGYPSSFVNRQAREQPSQPTRIVVLKPSPGKGLDIKAMASSSPSSPGDFHGVGPFDEPGDAESREAAKEITCRMRENLMGHCRNETLFSSVLSNNGYIGDDSSFNKSDSEYLVGNLSDSEIMSPVSRHSWDCPNRVGSPPFSSSSFSRASDSPESSVCREAKKRLSERWTMMALNGTTQQQKYIPRTSSTLGEMLSLSDTKAPTGSNGENNEVMPEARASTSCINSGLNQEENTRDSPKTLERSKSTPGVRTNTEASGLVESRSLKSSWKVSNFFFFRNKKAINKKTGVSQTSNEPQLAALEMPSVATLPGKTSHNCLSFTDSLTPDSLRQQSLFPNEGEPRTTKLSMAGNASETQDQPSPISVLQPPFEEEINGLSECSALSMPKTRGQEMCLKSNLIDKSPLIGSIARTLSWDDDDDLSPDITRPVTVIQEYEDWYFFIETLLTSVSLGCNRWHSPDSPLDPSLRDKYPDPDNHKDLTYESKRRQQGSNQKLIFDCVNAIVAETTTTLSRNSLSLPVDLVDHAWSQLKDWLSGSGSTDTSLDMGETVHTTNSLAAERVVRDEVVGRTWLDGLRIEMDELGIEIEGKLLQELVEETFLDLTW